MPSPQELRAFGLRAGTTTESNFQCPLCHTRVEEPVVAACCNYVFCWHCLLTWFKEGRRDCPVCGTDVNQTVKRTMREEANANAVEVRPRERQQDYAPTSAILQRGAYGSLYQTPSAVNSAPEQRYQPSRDIQQPQYPYPQVYQQITTERSTVTTQQPFSLVGHSHNTFEQCPEQYPEQHSTQSPAQFPAQAPSQYLEQYRGEAKAPRAPQYDGYRPSRYPDYDQGGEQELDPRDGLRTIGPSGRPMIRVDAGKLSRAIHMKFNTVPDPHGIRNHPSYRKVVAEVFRCWEQLLQRREGVNMLQKDLMGLFCDELDDALNRAGVRDLRGGDDIPQAVDDFAESVAKAAIREP